VTAKLARPADWRDGRTARQANDAELVGEIRRIIAESFVKTMKRDYVTFMPKPDAATAVRNLAIAFEHYNELHPHSALKYCSPREFRRTMARERI